MRSAIHSEFGNPSTILVVEDRPIPEPLEGQVRIKTILSSIHNHDLLTVAGKYGYKPSLPATGGSEAVGIVDKIGDGVKHLQLGQRVAVGGVHGTWAEYFVSSGAGAIPLPDEISDETAAQLVSMPLSALVLLDFLEVRAGDWILQNAATGAVGKVLTQIARTRGINVVNLVRRQEAVAELEALGIGNVVATGIAGWQDQVRKIIGPASFKAAVDGVAGPLASEMLSLLGDGGLLVSFGGMSGRPMQLPSSELIFKQVTVKGFWLSKIRQGKTPEEMAKLVGELIQLAADGHIELQVGGIFDLADVAKAAAASSQPGRTGKILLRP